MTERDFSQLREEVDALRRRLDEQGSVLRRTHQAVTGLAESVGQVVSSHRQRERGQSLNSFVAYLLFTMLLGGGFFALYQARAGDLVGERERAVEDRDAARGRAAELQSALAERDQAEKSAREYLALLEENKRSEAIARYGEVLELRLTPTERAVFERGVEEARAEIVDAGYLAGLDAFRASDFDRAAVELTRALAYEDQGPRAAQMRYYLGVSQFKKGAFEEAAHQLELAIAGRVDQAGITDTRYYLAAAMESLSQLAEARTEYEKFASAHPTSPLAPTARRKVAQLSRRASPTN